jgi:hypothetical protein
MLFSVSPFSVIQLVQYVCLTVWAVTLTRMPARAAVLTVRHVQRRADGSVDVDLGDCWQTAQPIRTLLDEGWMPHGVSVPTQLRFNHADAGGWSGGVGFRPTDEVAPRLRL